MTGPYAYDFLILALLFLAPGALAWAARPDLRPHMARAAVAALPFAATERLFYPTYWSPHFLFDLVDVLGFGLEDVLFLVGLAAFTATAYPVAFGRGYEPREPRSGRRALARGASLVAAALGAALALVAAGVPVIYAAIGAMAGAAAAVVARRPDLLAPSLLGGLVSTLVYAALCWLYAALLPGVFARAWHTERFLNRFAAGVPLEELLYGWAAGSVATVFLPFAFGLRFVRRPAPPASAPGPAGPPAP
jgi:hypothetical protein